MADFSKLKMGDTTYNVKDAEARAVTTELGATHQCIDIHDLQTTLLADGGAYDHLTPFHCTLPAGFKFTDKKTIDVPGSLTLWSALDFQAASYAGTLVLSDGTIKSVIVKTELSPIEIYAYDVASGGGGGSSEDVEKLKTDVAALQTDNTTNKSDISSLKSDVSTLQSDNTTNKSDISANKQSISALQDNFSSLQNDVSTNKSDISNLKSDNTTNKSDIADLKTSQGTQDTSIKALQDGKKDVQTAVSDPTASGTTITAIDTISQDAQGKITVTKKTIRSASTSQSGVVTTYTSLATDTDASHVPTRGVVNDMNTRLAQAQADIADLQKTSGGGTVTGGITRPLDFCLISSQQVLQVTSSRTVTFQLTNGCKHPIMVPIAISTSTVTTTPSPSAFQISWWVIPQGKTMDIRQNSGWWANLIGPDGERLYSVSGSSSFTCTKTFTDWEPAWSTAMSIMAGSSYDPIIDTIGVGKDVSLSFPTVPTVFTIKAAWVGLIVCLGGPGPQMVAGQTTTSAGVWDVNTSESYTFTQLGTTYDTSSSPSFTYGDLICRYISSTSYTTAPASSTRLNLYHVMRSGGGPTVTVKGMNYVTVSTVNPISATGA